MSNQNQNPVQIPLPNQPNGTQGILQLPHQIRDETQISLDDVGEATKYEQDCLEFRKFTNTQRVTLRELGEATEYKQKVVEKKLGGLGAPIWATTMENNLRTDMNTMENNLRTDMNTMENNLRTSINNLQTNFLATMISMENRISQRLNNCFAVSPNDLLYPLPNLLGQYPNNFPATVNDLKNINDQNINPILQFYGLNYQNIQIQQKKNTLASFLGIRLRF